MPVEIPYPGREAPYASLAYVERTVSDELYRAGVFNIAAMFRAALAAGALEAAKVAQDFALALEQTVRSSKNQLASLHHQVGTLMQEEVLAAYEQALHTRGRNLAPYRLSTRDAGGRLAAALGSSEMFRATYDGIGFGNVRFLDSAARQWHRLNFGAAPGAGARPRSFAVKWQGLAVGAVGYQDQGPSPAFLLPRGRFVEGAFFPTGPTPLHPTRGIAAWNFLDAAPQALAREIGPAYSLLFERWAASAVRGAGPLSRVVNVAAPPAG